MRGGAGFWLLLGGLVVLHFLLHLGFGIGRGAPDLLTLALLLGARSGGMARGAALGFAFGLLQDAFSVLAFGSNALAMTVVGALGSFTRELFVGESILFVFVYLFAGKWMRDLLQWIVVGEGLREPFLQEMVVASGVSALYLAGVGILVVAVLSGGLREARA
ncbi:MAG: hypothetical protein R3223_12870 [Longimicrobiales bacterium]|nr:hypothetical protein [Longimicrobiales bacterium]